MAELKRATTFTLRSVKINSPRFEKDGGSYDITAVTPEINLYESLFNPYITGEIMVADTGGISNQIRASGQETVTIELYVEDDAVLQREFVIYSVKKQIKGINSASSIYIYSIIEKHGFFSFFQRINKSFNGNISGIIYNVFRSELYGLTGDDSIENDIEKKLLSAENFEDAYQTVKVISPNKTPLGFCMWLAKRATTEYGEPFFLYSSLKEGPQFKSLGSLLSASPINDGKPYRYSQVYTATNFIDEIHRILEIDVPETDNSIALAKAGAFGVLYQSIDPFFKSNDRTVYEYKFNQDEYFKQKKAADRTLAEFNIYDENFRIGPKSSVLGDKTVVEGQTLAELNSQIHAQINTSFMFEDFNSYDEEPNIERHIYKMRRSSDIAFLNKQKMTVVIPGYNMLNQKTNTSIGKIIDVRIPSDITHVATPDEDEIYDKKKTAGDRGGLFLTTKVRHRFGLDNNYVASLEISKMASAEKL